MSDRTTNPPDALAAAMRNARSVISECDLTAITSPLEDAEQVGHLYSALVLLVQAVEETPGLSGSSTRSMWPYGEPQSVRDAADSKGGKS